MRVVRERNVESIYVSRPAKSWWRRVTGRPNLASRLLDEGGEVGGDAGYQQAYDNLLAVLASEGMSAADLVKITYFTTDRSPEALKLSRDIRVRKLGDANPSSTYLVIAGLAGPDLKVEIEGEAVGKE